MGKPKTPSAPAAPDPVVTANAQASANKETAVAQSLLNMVDQYTPNGNLTYSQIDTQNGVPRFSATQTLSPDAQRILNLTNQASIKFGETANRQLENVSGRLSQPFDLSSFGTAPTANENTRQSVRDSTLQRFQPQLDRDRAALETSLANQGLSLNSEAYRQATDRFDRQVNDFYLATDATAGNEMSRLYGLEANSRDRALNEATLQRQVPLNELIAMLSGTQVQQPSFVSPPQTGIGQTPVADSIYASYNGQLNNYNQAANASAANNQGLFGLVGAGLGAYAQNPGAFSFSDRRLKRNIRRLGEMANGLGVYVFNYIWGGPQYVGFMADEVRQVVPSAVINVGGFDMVNYEEAVNEC